MTLAWFIAPYKRDASGPHPFRYCAVRDFDGQISADGGAWSETEVLGNVALAKVRASDATLTAINAAAGMLRIPNHFTLSDTLGDLTAGQRTAIVNQFQTMGYDITEIRNVMPAGGWGAVTLGQVLNFAATRRFRSRWDDSSSSYIFDGPSSAVRPVSSVDQAVQ